MVVNARIYPCIAAALLMGALASAQQEQVRAWSEPPTVVVKQPFLLYVEASGSGVILPKTLTIDGLRIDPSGGANTRSFSFTPSRSQSTHKRGFYATASKTGTINVPPIEITVDGKTLFTKAFTVEVREANLDNQLTENDLLLIEMDVDKREVYQGAPIVLTQQVWQIIFNGISSGPAGGARNVSPSTEGFYAIGLDETLSKEVKNQWRYDVRTERKLLYPTRTGTLTIGPWRWDGIALVRGGIRRKFRYNLDADPITVTVKPLPERPPGFSGSIGTFKAKADLSRYDLLQGVPAKLTVTITGNGNPDAIGAPRFDAPAWAFLTKPESTVTSAPSPGSPIPSISKSFVYNITPLQSGDLAIPPIDFIWFDPEASQYKTESMGPFQVTASPSGEAHLPPVLADELNGDQRVIILAEDIRPVLARTGSIAVNRGSGLSTAALGAAPVFVYALFAFYMTRRRRFETDTSFARAHRARPNALKALDAIVRSTEPADELYRVVLSFIGHTLNVNETGMTSNDVRLQLVEAGFELSLTDNAVKILRACERARYASQGLSETEIHALIHGARAFVNEFDEASRKGTRR